MTPAEAFHKYIADPDVQRAIEIDQACGKTLTFDLLRDCFAAGAKYASDEYNVRNTKGGTAT